MSASLTTSWLRFLTVLVFLVQSSEVSGRTNKEFEQHVTQAQQYYSAKDYNQAIAEFDAAYQIDPLSSLLINIGRCHYLADRPKEALVFYNKALQTKLTPSERAEVSASVAKATIKYQEQQQANQQQAAIERQEALRKQQAVQLELTTAKPAEKKPFYKTGWFWGTIGGVAATAVIVGVVVARPWESPSPPPTPGEGAIVLR